MYIFTKFVCCIHAVHCSVPSNPINGLVNCDRGDDGVISYQDTCTTTCNTGYEIQSGDVTRTCLSDGTFDRTEGTCSRGM